MKKSFLALALLATVAIGGAATAQVYLPGGNQPIPCNAIGTTCALVFGPIGYNVPSPNPGGRQQGDAGTFVNLAEREFTP